MKRKMFCLLMAAIMVLGMLSACGKGGQTGTGAAETEPATAAATDPATDAATEPATDAPTEPAAQGEPIPEPKYYYSFDGEAEGAVVKEQVKEQATVDEALIASERSLLYSNGVKGQSLYFDGKFGVQLPIEPVGESWSVSFWMYSRRMNTFGATIQFGQDLLSVNKAARWVNITSDGTYMPYVWSRDEATDVWGDSCIYNAGTAGLSEWAHIAVTVDENELNENGTKLIAHLYINGEEFLRADGAQMEVAKSVFSGTDDFRFLLGINCWDAVYRGAIDELYVFDQALTPGQVLTLYQDGDASAEKPAEPEGADTSPEPTEPLIRLPAITVDENAIDTVGSKTKLNDFWSDWTRGWEIKDGETKTVKLNNYTGAKSDGTIFNYNNYVIAFVNVMTDGEKAPAEHEGYAEYAVVRADNYAWKAGNVAIGTFEASWGDDWWTFRNMMSAAKVTLTITRSGSEVTIDGVYEGGDGNEYTQKAVIPLEGITAADPCYFFFTGESCYVEILSVE